MAKLKKGDLVVETSLPKEIVTLKSQGFVVIAHDNGGPLSSGPASVINETGHAEVVKPAPKQETKK